MANSAPPVGDTKKPATTPPAKAGADGDKAKGSAASTKPAEAEKGSQKTAAPSAGQDKAKGAGGEKAATGGQQRFDRMAVRTKLAVSEPGDAVEREADQVAARISRKVDAPGGHARVGHDAAGASAAAEAKKEAPKPSASARTAPGTQPIARQAAPDADESSDGPVTPENSTGDSRGEHAANGTDTQARIKQLIGQGEPMGEAIRERMEHEFCRDFSHVRIHQDATANDLCRSLGALAFTTGSDIFFASGRFQPGSPAGITLLAHELAHVVQQQFTPAAIARKLDPDLSPKYQEKNAAASAAALADLSKLEIPAVKARHLTNYQGRIPGQLRRKRGYDRGKPNQVEAWNKNVQIDEAKVRQRLTARGLTNVPQDAGESFKLVLGAAKKPQSRSITQLQKLLRIPTWSRHGKPLGSGFQVDHIIELQVSGENGEGIGNSLQNMELLDQPSNSSSGGAIRSRIYSKVDAYLKTFKPAPKRQTFLKTHDIVFEHVQANMKSGAAAGDSSWWNLAEIQDAVPLDHITPAPATSDEGTATAFLLLSGPGGVVTQRITHPAGAGTFPIEGTAKAAVSGLTIDSVTINDKAAAGAGTVGSISGSWNLPKKWTPADPKVALTLGGDGKHRGYPSKLGKTKLEFAHLSPVTLDDVNIEDGQVTAEGVLTPSLPLLDAPITVALRGEDVRFSLDYSATQLALSAPGVSIEDAMVSVFYSTKDGFGVSGGLDFILDKVGGGQLQASFSEGKGIAVEGAFDFNSDLFDVANVQAWWRSEGGFGASGDLAITKPGKIKGLKSAKLKALYSSGVFTASGSAETDIPGIKGFKADITFIDEENFSITGSGDLEKLPGLEAGSLTMTVEREGQAWSLSGKGTAIPSLPGGAKANIEASYAKGVIVAKGVVGLTYGNDLLRGNVDATVTNAASVDAAGMPSGQAGTSFKAFGQGHLSVKLGQITGTIDVDLLPAGDLRVGGKLTADDQKIFDEYPKPSADAAKPKMHTIASVPIPGLGFGVAGINVGVVLGASWGYNAYASIGPGFVRGIHLTIAKFNPRDFTPSDIKIEEAGAKLEIPATAGVSLSAAIELTLDAVAVRGGARLTATAAAEIAKSPPAITGETNLKWSYEKGLDIQNKIKVDPKAQLRFTLEGTGFAELNLFVDTITLWSRTWPLGAVAFELPLNFSVGADFGWSSMTGFRTEPADLFKAPEVNLGANDFQNIADGSPSTKDVKTVDAKTRTVIPEEELVCREPSGKLPNQSVMPPMSSSATQVNPKREEGTQPATPVAMDEHLFNSLGPGAPLDEDARAFYEHALAADLTSVRVYTGAAAAREADKLSAKAFTIGNRIAFAEGKYRPNTPEGQELIAHELAHVVQQRNGAGQAIIMRWPAVTRTSAQTTETPASIRARTLSDFMLLTETQLDWATSPALQADAAALTQFRDLQTFAGGPHIIGACGDLGMGDIIAKGVPGVFPALQKYTDGATGHGTAWLRRTNDTTKAERWGSELTTLEGAWPAANLSLVMRAPDPISLDSPFEKLENPAAPELPNFISYLGACSPVLSADDGSEIDSFLALRREGAMPQSYLATIAHVKNYHHFTKVTLDGLTNNEAFPQWKQRWPFTRRPLTVVLYPAVDHNGAFHRNLGLQDMVTDSSILTIVVEGLASVADYQAQLAPVAARYGVNGEVQQAMIGGHGNATILVLAGTANASVTSDSLGTAGASGASTSNLMAELTRLMSSDPRKRRIVLDACLTNSHHVASALRASPADAAADVNAAITANPSLRDVVAGVAGAGANVFGSNASFAPAQTTFMSGGTAIGLGVPGDPDLIASKIQYVEFGTEPEGCMRAVLECWATDQIAGTHDCRDAMLRRIAGTRSAHVAAAHTDTWRESIIQPLYDLAANHYWGNGDAIRQMGTLAGSVFELYWAGKTPASALDASLAPIAGNAAHIDQLFTRVSADPHYGATPRVAVVIEQVWMRYTPARRAHFMTALGRYATCLAASGDVEMGLVMPQVPLLLTLPPLIPPPADQLRLALMAAHSAPVGVPPALPLPAHAAFLRSLLGAGPTFPPALGISAALGGLAGEGDILVDIGRPITGPSDPRGPAPAANIDPIRDATALNDFRVTPLRRRGVVNTVSGDLMVRSTPTTSTDRNVFSRLPAPTPVVIIGEWDRWYAIEQPGRTGFVAKRYITLDP